MRTSIKIRWMLAATTLLAATAHAHDPALHKTNAESPKCEKLKNMHNGNMKADDPIMQAMMVRCMRELHSDDKSTAATSDAEAGISDTHSDDH